MVYDHISTPTTSVMYQIYGFCPSDNSAQLLKLRGCVRWQRQMLNVIQLAATEHGENYEVLWCASVRRQHEISDDSVTVDFGI